MPRQYYKSGAYENPVAVIDREANMIYADTIRNIGKVTAGIIDLLSSLIFPTKDMY